MRLKKLKLNNIRSYKQEEVVFEDGATLLSGDIGSGKTSILLAVEYALFGLQPGQRGSSLLSNGEDFGSVVLDFLVGDSEVSIERKLKRGSKSISQDYASITIDGTKIESSVTEIKTKVLELLNYPPEFIKKNNLLFRYTVYTPQEEMKQIIMEDADSRLNILRHIFGIDKYKRIKENLSLVTSKLREHSRVLQFEVKALDDNKEKLETDKKYVKILDERITNKNLELEKIVLQRKSIEDELKSLFEKIKEKENFLKEIEKSTIMLSNKKDLLMNHKISAKELQDKVDQHKDSFNQEFLEELIKKIDFKKIGLEELNKNYIGISGEINSISLRKKEDAEKKDRIFRIDICPTCLQDVSETHKHNILNEAEKKLKEAENREIELNSTLDDLNKKISLEKSELNDLEKQRSDYSLYKIRDEEIKNSREKLELLEKQKKVLEEDVSFLEKHIASLKNSSFEFSKFDNLYKAKDEELKDFFRKEKQTEIELAENRKELELTNVEIFKLEKKIDETEKIKTELIDVLDLEKWLSTSFSDLVDFTERNIMVTLRNEFSKIFNKWFAMLTTDAFYINLDENFTPIITQGDFELDYAFLSGGERTAVALAYRLALNQILNSLMSKIRTQGLVILDEPTDGFSEQQLDKVRDILQELNAEQLILVSHEAKIESFVDNVIRFKKEAGVSTKEV